MHRLFLILLVTLLLCGASSAVAQNYIFKTDRDSMLVIFGDYKQQISVAGLKSPDTSYLDKGHDLILQSAVDSVFIPRSDSGVTVGLIRSTDTLIEVFFFYHRNPYPTSTYLPLLQQYPSFGQTPLPAFSGFGEYPRQDSLSAMLRDRYRLDSIAGTGGDVSRMLNLLHWVHTSIKWDGSKECPTGSLVDQMDSCINYGRTMHCGAMASTYAAVCNAVGLPARQIVCLPMDTTDPDCHSTDIVYSDSLGKWLYMDPTFEAYFMDGDGNMLCTRKVRDRLAHGEAVVVNATANTNGVPKDAEEYIGYMGKNLFHFLTWGASGKGIMLNPVGYNSEENGKEATYYKNHSTVLYTDNADIFWAKPTVSQGN